MVDASMPALLDMLVKDSIASLVQEDAPLVLRPLVRASHARRAFFNTAIPAASPVQALTSAIKAKLA
jgi:hypothetical protein